MSPARASLTDRLLPPEPNRWVRTTAWLSLLANALLVLSGGLVRLTASGLGCPTWPRCTDDSWTATREMGLHGAIEFGNRTLTFVLTAVAVLTFLAVWRSRRQHPGLLRIAVWLGIGIIVQALVGGVTVRTELNPWVVGVHFVLSALMIALAAVLVNRTRRLTLPRAAAAERPGLLRGTSARNARVLAVTLCVLGLAVVYVGTLVTGTGPHAGDADVTARHAFDPYWVTRFHTGPAYLLLAATVAGIVAGGRARWPRRIRGGLALLGALLVVQGLIGYYQYFNGLPVVAVAVHLVGAAAVVAVVAMVAETLYAVSAPAVAAAADPAPDHHLSV